MIRLVRYRPRWAIAGLLAAAVGLSSCGISLQSLPKLGGVSGPTYTLTATFANVVNLPANAEVRVGAFSVGYVSSIGLADYQAVVTMKVKTSTRLPVGTTANIAFDTPLGEDFVQLIPPANPATTAVLANGTRIPEQDTTTAPSVEDTFAALGALLNNGGINQLQTIIDQTNLALGGNQSKIRLLIQNLAATVSSFADNTPAIDRALSAIATLSQTLNHGSQTISDGIAAINPAISILTNENQDLDDLFVQLDKLSTAANTIVDNSYQGTISTVDNLKPLLDQLVGVQSELNPALQAINALEVNTPHVIPGDYVQLSIKANVDVPPVPSDAAALQKVTLDPPEESAYYDNAGVATLIEGGLP